MDHAEVQHLETLDPSESLRVILMPVVLDEVLNDSSSRSWVPGLRQNPPSVHHVTQITLLVGSSNDQQSDSIGEVVHEDLGLQTSQSRIATKLGTKSFSSNRLRKEEYSPWQAWRPCHQTPDIPETSVLFLKSHFARHRPCAEERSVVVDLEVSQCQ